MSHQHGRRRDISPAQAAVCDCFVMMLDGEVGSGRRKGSVLLFVWNLWSALQLQFHSHGISPLPSPRFRLQSPKFWRAQLELSVMRADRSE